MSKYLAFLSLFLTVSLCNVPAVAKTPDGYYIELVHQAWLIHHGIETSQWKDTKCKARALELVDETKLTQARLDQAIELAGNAGVAMCGHSIRTKGAAPKLPNMINHQVDLARVMRRACNFTHAAGRG